MTVFGCVDLVDSYSAFYENGRTTTGLAGYPRERGFTRAFLAGLALEFCVRYSAEDAAPPRAAKPSCRQLQVLRDRGYLDFVSRGYYRLPSPRR